MCHYFEKLMFVFIPIVLAYITSVEGLSCVQCSSLQSQECIEGNIESTPCEWPNSTYCIKYEGKRPDINIKLVVRECSNHDEPSQCKTKSINGQQVDVCFHSCTEDGCNGNSASTLTIVTLHLVFITLLLPFDCIFGFGIVFV